MSDEPGVMGLLASDWARWWSAPPLADEADLAQWLEDVNFPVPPVGAWVWRPSGDDVLSCIRSCPNSASGADGIPYSAWKALSRVKVSNDPDDIRPPWVVYYFLELITGLSTIGQNDVPDDFNVLLCHVLGKAKR